MNRAFTVSLFLVLSCFVASEIYAQVFAQAAPPATPAPAAQPRAVNVPGVVAAPQPVPVVVGKGPGQGAQAFFFSAGGYAGEDDPELADLTKSEHELSQQSDELMREFSSTEDREKRDSVKRQLREVLAKQFDVQRQRREHELAKVEERLRKLREQLRKRNDARETIIDRRLEHLITDAEGLGWTPPAGDGARPQAIGYGTVGPARTPGGFGGRR
jgi:hypothetical protein